MARKERWKLPALGECSFNAGILFRYGALAGMPQGRENKLCGEFLPFISNHLTYSSIVAKLDIPANRSEATFYDDDLRGFGLRACRGGKRSWVAVYRIGKKVRRVTIGDASVVGPEEAIAKARKIPAKADLGEDIHAERKDEEVKAATTLGIVIDQYIKDYVEQRQ
jgi:hypothetical protein